MKRTKQIDQNRQVVIDRNAKGLVWTTKGDIEMSPEDKAHLSQKLRYRKRESVIKEIVDAVQRNAAVFLEATFRQIAPAKVIESLDTGKPDGLFLDWMKSSGFAVRQDGLKTVILIKGQVINEMTAHVDLRFEGDVDRKLKSISNNCGDDK